MIYEVSSLSAKIKMKHYTIGKPINTKDIFGWMNNEIIVQ